MAFKAYKYFVGLMWLLFAAVAFVSAITNGFFNDGKFGHNLNALNLYVFVMFIFAGAAFLFIGYCTLKYKRLILLLLVPFFIYSIYYFVGYAFEENIRLNNIYQGLLMLFMGLCSIHVVLFKKVGGNA